MPFAVVHPTISGRTGVLRCCCCFQGLDSQGGFSPSTVHPVKKPDNFSCTLESPDVFNIRSFHFYIVHHGNTGAGGFYECLPLTLNTDVYFHVVLVLPRHDSSDPLTTLNDMLSSL
ncbi:uncharacterized protein QC761_108105 [Podospora bellae-mahoneyi]|uniref:Uncharacterized protein n=1 Tax=Podospora bellae-mahoneyi TaxID=2093777 RepID=A0ABR0FYD2_9PEZI|nr:hypothetical protein QC761_108105 [Podospora bellae-mahoneyi]